MAVVDVKIPKAHSANLINESVYVSHALRSQPVIISNEHPQPSTMSDRINSALVTEQDLNSYKRPSNGNTNNNNAGHNHVTYTRFKPVTSHPSSSLIATLYRQQALGEQTRFMQPVNDRLPQLFQRSKFAQPPKRRRGIRSFNQPASGQNNSPRQEPKRSADDPHVSESLPSHGLSRGGSASTGVGASAAWTAVHASISANGRSMFPPSGEQRRSSNVGSAKSVTTYHHPHTYQQRTTVNYVPFYEIRGRGDGASVVDVPSIDVEGKKIEGGAITHEKPPLPVTIANLLARKDEPKKRKDSEPEIGAVRSDPARTADRTPTDTNDETIDSLVNALMRRSIKDVASSTATPTKVEKKVRFSSSVTTNQIEEPSYTETLLESLRRRIETTTNAENHSVSSAGSRGGKEKCSDGNSITKCPGTDDDEPVFVTPVMKVIVTKRRGPTGAESKEATQPPQEPQTSQINPQRRIANMASRVINNYVSISPPNDVLRRGTQATRRASTAGQARSSEALARVSKLVPKRQTVVMPTFPKPPAWSKRSLTTQSSTNSRLRSTVAANTAFNAAVRGSSFEKSPRPEVPSKQHNGLENLQSRLTGAGSGVYISTSQNAKRPSTTHTAPDRVVPDGPNGPTSGAASKSIGESSVSMRNAEVTATDFQPIPTMPDHINFCDPHKTELIMRWLDDVNKKRNIDIKIKRGATLRRIKAT